MASPDEKDDYSSTYFFATEVKLTVEKLEHDLLKKLEKQDDEINYLLTNIQSIMSISDQNEHVVKCLRDLEKCSEMNDYFSFMIREKILNSYNYHMIGLAANKSITMGLNLINFNLDLSYHYLTRFPSKIFTDNPNAESYWRSIKGLDLTGNNLSHLPPEIGMFVNLRKLRLAANQLSDLPEEVRNLKKVRFLHLQHNKFDVLPEVLSELNLTRLHLICNKLKSVPENIPDAILYFSDQFGAWQITREKLLSLQELEDVQEPPSRKRMRSM